MQRALNLGRVVKPWGKIVMVARTGGERYYWLKDEHGTISMMPATTVEAHAKTA